jgi:hypothetical protein
LRDERDVADGDGVLDLQRGEARDHLREPPAVALQRLQGLLCPGQDLRRVLDQVPLVAEEQRDRRHGRRDGDDRQSGLAGDAFGRTVPGAGLGGLDRPVGHQVHPGPDDALPVLAQHDRAVHLGQLAQGGRGERDVEREAAGGDLGDHVVVAEHDERARTTAQDALQAVAHRGSGRDGTQLVEQHEPPVAVAF